MLRMTVSAALLAAALAAVPACGRAPAAAPAPEKNRITQLELDTLDTENLYAAIQRLRPAWLVPRGRASLRSAEAGRPVVYVDGIRYGTLGSLRSIPSHTVREIRYESASEATTRRGTGHLGGAIVVVTKSS